MQVWGLHNDTLTTELTEENFVSLSWDTINDLSQIPYDQKILLNHKVPQMAPVDRIRLAE